jgi:hypothetical protein
LNRTRILGIAALLGGFALSGPARAGLLPVNVTPLPESGNFRWTYSIVLPTDTMIKSGDYFTIYDFAGYVPGGESAPAGWAFSSSNTGATPSGVLPNDDPALPNLTWKYSGETQYGQTGLGNFWAVSEFGQGTEDSFTARSHNASYGTVDNNVTTTTVPVQVPVPPGVPEPATLAMAGIGLPLAGLLRRWKRSKTA